MLRPPLAKPPSVGGIAEPRSGAAMGPPDPGAVAPAGYRPPASPGNRGFPDQPSGGSRVLTGDSDEVLVARAFGGDDPAFDEIVGRYERVIFNLTLRMSGNREDARDLTQDVFLKAWRGLGGFDPKHRFFSWIYRIAIHECLNHRRRSGRLVELTGDPESTEVGPERRTEAHEAEEKIHAALGRLRDGDRELLVLRHFLDRSHEEIAEILRVPAKRVKSRLYTARQRLRAELEQLGVRP